MREINPSFPSNTSNNANLKIDEPTNCRDLYQTKDVREYLNGNLDRGSGFA